MTEFTMTRTLGLPYERAVTAVREGARRVVGFGVLAEIDIAATLKKKLGVDVAPKIILGAYRPQLALQALGIDPGSRPTPFNDRVSGGRPGSAIRITGFGGHCRR